MLSSYECSPGRTTEANAKSTLLLLRLYSSCQTCISIVIIVGSLSMVVAFWIPSLLLTHSTLHSAHYHAIDPRCAYLSNCHAGRGRLRPVTFLSDFDRLARFNWKPLNTLLSWYNRASYSNHLGELWCQIAYSSSWDLRNHRWHTRLAICLHIVTLASYKKLFAT